jgi:hypothetical protein
VHTIHGRNLETEQGNRGTRSTISAAAGASQQLYACSLRTLNSLTNRKYCLPSSYLHAVPVGISTVQGPRRSKAHLPHSTAGERGLFYPGGRTACRPLQHEQVQSLYGYSSTLPDYSVLFNEVDTSSFSLCNDFRIQFTAVSGTMSRYPRPWDMRYMCFY